MAIATLARLGRPARAPWRATCAGTPVIVGDTGGLAEIVTHGAAGLKVPPGAAGALAAAMARLLADPAAAGALGAAGRATAAGRFGWAAIAGETLAVYQLALAGRHDRRLSAGS